MLPFLNSNMKKLFTFGCSYTYFFWPTWADMLSLNYDHFENWGWAGLGNRAIAERLAECYTKQSITKDDTVIVQWSTHLRFDWWNKHPYTGFSGWQTNGNVYCDRNRKIFNDNILMLICNEDAMIMHSLNNILLVANMLDNIGCKWYFTSIGDIRQLGSDLDSLTKMYEHAELALEFQPGNINTDNFELYKKYPNFRKYEKSIWKDYKEHWIEPITYTAQRNVSDFWSFQAEHDLEPWIEAHPSPLQHYKWLSDHLAPKLSNNEIDCKDLLHYLIDLKSRNNDAIKFEQYLNTNKLPQLKYWPHRPLGY